MTHSKSSKAWLREHFQDPYVKASKAKAYRSRAVYKLLEIQKKDQLIRQGMTVIDLGAAPGGWSQVAADLVGQQGCVYALDSLPMDPIAGVCFIQGDFTQEAMLEQLKQAIGDHPVDLVMSDMAPNISGIKAVDQPRAILLAELALDAAVQWLREGGGFVVKLFQGEGFDAYLKQVKPHFRKIAIRKPKASRPRSREVYLIAQGFYTSNFQ